MQETTTAEKETIPYSSPGRRAAFQSRGRLWIDKGGDLWVDNAGGTSKSDDGASESNRRSSGSDRGFESKSID
jgi:hypothetical protein